MTWLSQPESFPRASYSLTLYKALPLCKPQFLLCTQGAGPNQIPPLSRELLYFGHSKLPSTVEMSLVVWSQLPVPPHPFPSSPPACLLCPIHTGLSLLTPPPALSAGKALPPALPTGLFGGRLLRDLPV